MNRHPFQSNFRGPNTQGFPQIMQGRRPPFQPRFGNAGQFHQQQNFWPSQRPSFHSPRPDIPLTQNYDQNRGSFNRGGGFRGRGRGGFRGGSRGGRSGQGQQNVGIEAYYKPSMVQDPWKELEEEYWRNHQQPMGDALS